MQDPNNDFTNEGQSVYVRTVRDQSCSITTWVRLLAAAILGIIVHNSTLHFTAAKSYDDLLGDAANCHVVPTHFNS